MGYFDQAARFAAQADPGTMLRRLLPAGEPLRFREWLDTRVLPLPGGADRTADHVVAMDGPDDPSSPWLIVLEYQSEPDEDKIDVTLEEVALLRSRVRHGVERKGKYFVTAGIVNLTGHRDEIFDMTFSDGRGTRHAPLVWNVASDDAAEMLEAIASGATSWGMLFWVPLMARAEEEGIIARWKELTTAVVPDRRMRDNLSGIALVFAELAGRFLAWERGLEGWEMSDSMVVDRWIARAEAKMELKERRSFILRMLRHRFGDAIPGDVQETIDTQPSLEMLDEWFDAAITVGSLQDFIAVLRR